MGQRGAPLLAALALVGCATAPPAPTGMPFVSGRLVLQVDEQPGQAARSLSAAFDLRGDATRGELRLSTPLGTTLAEARWSPGEAHLVTPQGEKRFEDLEALSRDAFGESLPLRAWPDWLQGRPWPAESAQTLPAGAGFVQLGWTIDLARFDTGLLQARRDTVPAVRLRAQLDRP